MPYMGGRSGGGEWIAPPLGKQPVEVKKVQLYELNMSELKDFEDGYNQDVDGWPPPHQKCTEPSRAIGYRLYFGVYGSLEKQTLVGHDEGDRISWVSTFVVFGRPCNVSKNKFYVAWERYVAPVLGGMADGYLRQHVRNTGDPDPGFFEILVGARCYAEIKPSQGDSQCSTTSLMIVDRPVFHLTMSRLTTISVF